MAADLALAYTNQTERDHQALIEAIAASRIATRSGI